MTYKVTVMYEFITDGTDARIRFGMTQHRTAKFKGLINEIPISGSVYFHMVGGIAIYSVKFDSALIRKHPEYRLLRRLVLSDYSRQRLDKTGVYVRPEAEEALKR